MSNPIQYGRGRQLRLTADDAHNNGQTAESPPVADGPQDVASAACDALSQPLGLPPLGSCLLTDDHVAIAVGEGVPSVAEVVSGVLAALRRIEVPAKQLVVVACDAADTQHLTAALREQADEGVAFETHDPNDQDNLCFAGATRAERPLMINRRLSEAEVVLPITCSRPGQRGAFGGVFPAFSDSESQQRLQSPAAAASNGPFADEAEEAGWMLGATIVMQVVPGLYGDAQRIIAGVPESVAGEASKLTNQLWQKEVDHPADLVIATLTGDGTQQSWAKVGKALAAAAKVASDDAAVVLCTELTETLPEPFGELLARGDEETIWPLINEQEPALATTITHLLTAIQRGPVYLMSQLDSDTVEDLGLAPIANEGELQRLVSSRPNHVVLEAAQHLTVKLASAEAVQ